jgi:hypothetical protein
MVGQPDELAGLKKLLAALEGTDEHSKMTVKSNGNDVTLSLIETVRWEIKSLENYIAHLKDSHASRS